MKARINKGMVRLYVYPLGTGNDMSRHLKWGSGGADMPGKPAGDRPDFKKLMHMYMEDSTMVNLDCWDVKMRYKLPDGANVEKGDYKEGKYLRRASEEDNASIAQSFATPKVLRYGDTFIDEWDTQCKERILRDSRDDRPWIEMDGVWINYFSIGVDG